MWNLNTITPPLEKKDFTMSGFDKNVWGKLLIS